MSWNVFGLTMTCRRDILPNNVPREYLHRHRTDTSNKTKVKRFFEPVVEMKDVAPDGSNEVYRRVNVSFQSTLSFNFSTFKAVNHCTASASKRERGVARNKLTWDIETNAARDLYLGTYSRIDSIDNLLKIVA